MDGTRADRRSSSRAAPLSGSVDPIPIRVRVRRLALLVPLLLAVASVLLFHARLLRDSGADGGALRAEGRPRPTTAADDGGTNRTTAAAEGASGSSPYDRPCFRTGGDAVHVRPSRPRGTPLRPPFVNLGFPKMGSTSLHAFFGCGGYRSMHYRCNAAALGGTDPALLRCADCVRRSVGEGLSPFARCGTADAYAQLDDGSLGHFPQVDRLEEIVAGVPNGTTFLLPFRSMDGWYRSLSHWPRENVPRGGPYMSDGLRNAHVRGLPPGTGRNATEFATWFCGHVERVRDVVGRHEHRTLVEIDIDDPDVGGGMSDAFDVDEGCWGRANANAGLHPDAANVSSSRPAAPDLPWLVRGKDCIRGRNGRRRPRRAEPLPVVPGLPAWLFVRNDTCDDDDDDG